MTILGYIFIKENVLTRKDAQIDELARNLRTTESLSVEYREQVRKLREFHEDEKFKNVIPIDIADPTPDNPDARKMYIGRVAGFYRDIMEKKCLQMISVSHRLLEEETNERETDLYLKICVFICREWMKWGEQAVSEQIGYQTEPPPSPAEMKEELITQVKL